MLIAEAEMFGRIELNGDEREELEQRRGLIGERVPSVTSCPEYL